MLIRRLGRQASLPQLYKFLKRWIVAGLVYFQSSSSFLCTRVCPLATARAATATAIVRDSSTTPYLFSATACLKTESKKRMAIALKDKYRTSKKRSRSRSRAQSMDSPSVPPSPTNPLYPLCSPDLANHPPLLRQWFIVVLAISSSLFLYALDNTIVANIVPAIIDDLGHATELAWLSVG
jgi:hypothetical protein